MLLKYVCMHAYWQVLMIIRLYACTFRRNLMISNFMLHRYPVTHALCKYVQIPNNAKMNDPDIYRSQDSIMPLSPN